MVSSSSSSHRRFLTRSALTGNHIDYYQLLGIKRFTSDLLEIRGAIQNQLYESQANGLGLTDSLASLRIIQIRKAEAILTDPKSKQEYDLELKASDLLSPAARSGDDIVKAAADSCVATPTPQKENPSQPESLKSRNPSLSASYEELLMPAKRSADGPKTVQQPTPVVPAAKTPAKSLPSSAEPPPLEYRADVNTNPAGELPTHPDFEFFGVIGEGRESVVYDAYDLTLDRPVAIKAFQPSVLQDSQRAESVWKEAKFLAGVAHDNLLRIYSVNTERGWVIMERVEGSLRQQLKQVKSFDADRAREILRQGLEGLKYLHGKDKLHGEIHPDSLLVDADGRIRLSDSPGFSNSSEFICPHGPLKQIAPEMLSSDIFGPIGPTLDLYCLAYTVLELMAGDDFASFFVGLDKSQIDDPQTWMRWHASPTAQLAPLQELLPKLPADLVAVIEGLTPKKTRDRIASAEEALVLLQSSNNNGAAAYAANPDAPDSNAIDGDDTEKRGAVVIGNPNKVIFGAADDDNEVPKSLAEKLTDPEWLIEQLKNPKVVTGLAVCITLVVGAVYFTPSEPPQTPIRTVNPIAVANKDNSADDDPTTGGEVKPEVKTETAQGTTGKTKSGQKNSSVSWFGGGGKDNTGGEKKATKTKKREPKNDPKPAEPLPTPTGLKVVPVLAESDPWYFQTALPDDEKQVLFDHIRDILEESWEKPSDESLLHAEYHYQQGKKLWANEPRLHVAYGLFLSKVRQTREALRILETAVERQDEIWKRYSSKPELSRTFYATYEPHRELIRHQLQLERFEQAGLSTKKLLDVMNEQLEKDSDDEFVRKARSEQVKFVATVMAFLELPHGQQVNNYFDLEVVGDRMYEQLSSSEQVKFDQVYNAMANRFQKISTNDKQRREGVKLLQEERKESGFLPQKTAKSLQVTEVLRRSNRRYESRTRQLSRDDIRELDNDRWKGRRSEILIEVKRYIGETRAPLFNRAKSISVYIKPDLEFKRQDLLDSLPVFDAPPYTATSQLAKIVD